jgi:hypothetical protein
MLKDMLTKFEGILEMMVPAKEAPMPWDKKNSPLRCHS